MLGTYLGVAGRRLHVLMAEHHLDDSDIDPDLMQMRQYAVPLLESYGVDLVLSGHNHSYERSYLLDGHYGTSDTLLPSMIVDSGDGREDGHGAYEKPLGFAPHRGAVYTVAGSSGQTDSGVLLNHPAMYLSLDVLGSLVLDINDGRLDAKFLSDTGVVQDYFTMKKNPELVSFQDGVSPAPSYTGTQDTCLAAGHANTNYGTSETLWAQGGATEALLKWGNLNIPVGSTVRAATITLNVTNPSKGTYELYSLRRNWVEAEATWNQYAAGQNWQVPGAKGTSDRGTVALGTVAASSIGQYTITLNAAGIALVQSWVNDPSKNQGLLIDDLTVTDALAFGSSETLTVSNRPKLTITYAPW